MPGLVLQPIDQAAKAALAQQLACWAKTATGMTDRAVQYGTCCVSPTGETLGRWTIPPGLCDTYGELPFTSRGEPIVCDSEQEQFVPYYIYPDDVTPVDPNECDGAATQLDAPGNVAAGTPTDTEIPLSWDAVTGADGYIVEWSPEGAGTWTPVTSTTTSATITGLTAETTYDIRVSATDSTGAASQSGWSAVIQETTTA